MSPSAEQQQEQGIKNKRKFMPENSGYEQALGAVIVLKIGSS